MARPPKSLLKDSHPELAAQLVDKSLLPTLATGGNALVEWECDKGHRWFARPYNRTNAKSPTGCPVCCGKKLLVGYNDIATTHPEVAKLCLHPEDAYKYTASSGKVLEWKCEHGHIWKAPIPRLTVQGSRCPYCSGRYPVVGENDLATLRPDLAAQLKDKSLGTKLRLGSPKYVTWVCDKGHEWQASVTARVKYGHGCPYCSGRDAIVGENDLATTHPDLVKEMVHPELATHLKARSEQKVAWKCPTCGHIWYTTPSNRTHVGSGCPVCANKVIIPGYNDLATTNPELVSQLVHPEIATQVSTGSGRIVEWKCEKGHTWSTTVYRRAGKHPTGCPECANAGTSAKEQDLAAVVKQLMGDETVLTNDQSVLPGRMELDIVVPSRHVAIEFNGCLWHSEVTDKPSDYHENKQRLAQAAGYQLIFVWEDEWDTRRDAVISSVAHKLHAVENLRKALPDVDAKATERIGARSMLFDEVSNAEAAVFLEENHIQGAVTCSRAFALYDEDGDIRALLGLRSPRHNARMRREDGVWEVQRYATHGIVPGGFTRLLKYAEKRLLTEGIYLTQWVSFSSHDVSDGGLYEKAGFVVDKELPLNYKYVGNINHYWCREPKEKYQKRRFRDDHELDWDDAWTEHEAALVNGLYRIYDLGKTRWVKSVGEVA